MKLSKQTGFIIAGICAGAVNGLFGAGGGMVLVPLLTMLTKLDDDSVFPSSVAIILPVCIVSLAVSWNSSTPNWTYAIPSLIGSILGGICAGIWGKKLPAIWLHRLLGVMIIWGGMQYL